MKLAQKFKSTLWEGYVQARGLLSRGGKRDDVKRIVIYHSINSKDKESFRRQIRYLKEHYDVVSLSDFIRRIEEGSPSQRGLVCITFDDAYLSVYTNAAEVLDEFSIKPCIFVPVGFLESEKSEEYLKINLQSDVNERPMSWNQLRKLVENGYEVGGHSWDHVDFGESNVDYEKELLESKNKLEQSLDSRVRYFAFPFGRAEDISEESLNKVREYGYLKAFSGERSKVRAGEYLYPRLYVNPSWGVQTMDAVLQGIVDCNEK